MSNYTAVQFISWEIYTGPTTTQPPYYPGIRSFWTTDHRTDVLSQCVDIDARLLFVADAVRKAAALADTNPTTLKVFLAPEFLFRGAGGAYLHDLINGWSGPAPIEFSLPAPYNSSWGGLFGGLQTIAKQANYEDWLFVFGTAVSATFPTQQASNGKYLLDPAQPGTVYNTALIQRGGAGHKDDNYASLKQYISGIDFLGWDPRRTTVVHAIGSIAPAVPAAEIPADVMGVPQGGATFAISNVNDATGAPLAFGIEICLDHARSGGNYSNHFGRLRTANQNVKIQLVPSCGMRLIDASIRLLPAAGPTPHSYAFNCDGFSDAILGLPGSHTQIWNGLNGNPVPQVNKLVEASNGAPPPVPQVVAQAVTAVVNQVAPPLGGVVSDSVLWNNGGGVQGAGHVRVCASLPL